jgi:two-component system phosphate regulon response regulator PhoB
MKHILIVEDEKDLAELLVFNLERDDYEVTSVHDGAIGLEMARRKIPDMMLLDLMLPGMLGTEVCKALRMDKNTSKIPIIMLTARGDEIDRVVGFEVGADDYIVKPFSMRELLLRIKAVFRRNETEQPTPDLLRFGDIVIDNQRHLTLVNDKAVELTSTEYKLLLYLAERPGKLVSRETLMQNVWGYQSSADTRTVDTHITRLRGKLGAPGDLIKTVRGFGYKMEEI